MSKQVLIALVGDPLDRLDVFLKEKIPGYSRTYFQELIDQGLVRVNGLPAKKRVPLHPGHLVEVQHLPETPQVIQPENIPLDVLYEDEALLAINKPRDFVVHPAPGHPGHTVVNALLHRYGSLADQDPLRPGIIHRLDKDTSGILLIAKTRPIHEKLSLAFKTRLIHKEYLALCYGTPHVKSLRNHLGRDPRNRKKIAVVDKGKEAFSEFEILANHKGYSFVKIHPQTGRTHQIRVHLQTSCAPILGDPLYGSAKINEKLQLKHQMLHAYRLHFLHPLTGKALQLTAPIPQDMQNLLSALGLMSYCLVDSGSALD
ncbi:MAG: RluA family pseudouridine synthase [Chlamydiae bacterium]|nr:RluA family pseudouridine synthase [Chlamydiota bacterium]